jgi:adenine-specific DNA-methyltransferase
MIEMSKFSPQSENSPTIKTLSVVKDKISLSIWNRIGEAQLLSRAKDFKKIAEGIQSNLFAQMENGLVAHGDSLDILKQIPDSTVSLILTDPPYHSTKKDNIYGDKSFAEDQHFIDWMEGYAKEFARILKPNGSLYLFCATQMSGRLEVSFSNHLKPLNHITWTKPNDPGFDGWKGKMNKESLKRWYPHSERILFFEQKSFDPAHRSTLGHFLREARLQSGLSGHELTEIIGEYGSVNHGGAVSNWEIGRNIPSRDQYRKMSDAFLSTKKVKSMPPYEDIVRPFNMSGDLEYMDVWNFPSVRPYRGKHPAEKPLDMLRHIINASSYEGDIVLDCFAGSGSTGVASLNLNRLSVLIDIEEQWAKRAANRLEDAELLPSNSQVTSIASRRVRKQAGDTLF